MARTHLDRKNVGLARLIYRLRQDIDVYRIIGINAREAKRLGGDRISGAFFGYPRHSRRDMNSTARGH